MTIKLPLHVPIIVRAEEDEATTLQCNDMQCRKGLLYEASTLKDFEEESRIKNNTVTLNVER